MYPLDDQMANYSGAFSSGGSFAYDATSTSSGGGWKLKFDASMSNDIYGASDIVQPPAVIINYIICYKSMASGGDGLTVNPIPTSWIEAL